jgi:CRISPR-associated protein Cas5t
VIALHVQVPYGSFRKSYARSFAETYPFPPPATVYGMLLSLVGEQFRARHAGVKLAFAYAARPRVATTLRKLSRYKYGVPGKQQMLGSAPDFIETLCDIDFLCWVDSSEERPESKHRSTLGERVEQALRSPVEVTRSGVVCLGLSDDAVDEIALLDRSDGTWHWLCPDDIGDIELPVWVDHVGSQHTRWRRFRFDSDRHPIDGDPPTDRFVQIVDPRPTISETESRF